MPKVSVFMYSDTAQVQPEATPTPQVKFQITNPQHILRPMFIPGQFSFAITFGILDFDISLPHILRYTFSSPEGAILVDTEDNIKLPPFEKGPIDDLPTDMRGFLTSLDFKNVVFETDGEYKSELFFDGVSLGAFEIKAKGMKTNVPSA